MRHAEKVVLWATIERLIIKSRVTDGFSTEDLYGALGVNEFHEFRGREWSGDENLAEALDLVSKIDLLASGGRVFLADLFEYQKGPIFDPFGFLAPRRVWKRSDRSDARIVLEGTDATEQARRLHVSVFAKHPEEVARFYADVEARDFRLRFESDPDLATDSLAEHLAELIHQLLPGLYQFYATRTNDFVYEGQVQTNQKPAPGEVVGGFVAGVRDRLEDDAKFRIANGTANKPIRIMTTTRNEAQPDLPR